MKLFSQSILAIAGLCIAGGVLAGQVRINNFSHDSQPLKLEYRMIHKNAGQLTVYSATHAINLTDSQTIAVNEDGYQQVGLVVTAVNSHQIPLDTSNQSVSHCSVLHDSHGYGPSVIDVSYVESADGHGNITCMMR